MRAVHLGARQKQLDQWAFTIRRPGVKIVYDGVFGLDRDRLLAPHELLTARLAETLALNVGLWRSVNFRLGSASRWGGGGWVVGERRETAWTGNVNGQASESAAPPHLEVEIDGCSADHEDGSCTGPGKPGWQVDHSASMERIYGWHPDEAAPSFVEAWIWREDRAFRSASWLARVSHENGRCGGIHRVGAGAGLSM
eukprot:scaffold9164_cov29-Tisochrysis_lutea.AAC.5